MEDDKTEGLLPWLDDAAAAGALSTVRRGGISLFLRRELQLISEIVPVEKPSTYSCQRPKEC